MKVTVRQLGDVAVVDLAGKITLGGGDEALRRKVDELLHEGRLQILLNLKEVSYMDSSGVGGLAACYQEARSRNGTVKLVNPTGRVQDLLRLIRLEDVIELFDSEQEALGSFRGHRDA